jgi:hypothetical protein
MKKGELSNAVLYLLGLRQKGCDACGDPATELSFHDYEVKPWANKVVVKVVCKKSHHSLGNRTLSLREVEFVTDNKLWDK